MRGVFHPPDSDRHPSSICTGCVQFHAQTGYKHHRHGVRKVV
ncbi:hypothetical protein CCHR01_02245 [Colletotrichum chrysophilum]|uniref:Uncharacterized protein n=1 Tax=Colletotrichum chrysophilum TaxID=1836956 RepID=A0AAD9ENI0_9PEZI|nr:hypothetical protein CCHR01_02245 [Colletotrichum chrysophilum]